jgi:hypothetical protein
MPQCTIVHDARGTIGMAMAIFKRELGCPMSYSSYLPTNM